MFDAAAKSFTQFHLPVRAAFADWEKNHKGLVSGVGGSGGGSGGNGGGGGDNGGGAGQSRFPFQAFRNSSNSLRLETYSSRK